MTDPAHKGEDTKKTGADVVENLSGVVERLAEVVERSATKADADDASTKAPKTYTQAELDAEVASGRITAERAAEIVAAQNERRTRETVRAELDAQTAAQRIDAKIDAYMEAIPALRDKNSPDYKRVVDAFRELVADGSPKNRATELAALKQLFGSNPAALKGREGRREVSPETHGGGGGGRSGASDDGDGAPNNIPARNREYLRQQIAKGVYSGWDDPRVKSQVARLRERQAA